MKFGVVLVVILLALIGCDGNSRETAMLEQLFLDGIDRAPSGNVIDCLRPGLADEWISKMKKRVHRIPAHAINIGDRDEVNPYTYLEVDVETHQIMAVGIIQHLDVKSERVARRLFDRISSSFDERYEVPPYYSLCQGLDCKAIKVWQVSHDSSGKGVVLQLNQAHNGWEIECVVLSNNLGKSWGE